MTRVVYETSKHASLAYTHNQDDDMRGASRVNIGNRDVVASISHDAVTIHYTVTAPRNAAQCAEWSLREANMGQLAE